MLKQNPKCTTSFILPAVSEQKNYSNICLANQALFFATYAICGKNSDASFFLSSIAQWYSTADNNNLVALLAQLVLSAVYPTRQKIIFDIRRIC